MRKITVLAGLLMAGMCAMKAQRVNVLHNFTNDEYPYGTVTVSGDVLYGMAAYDGGGANGRGYIFSINKDGSGFTDLWDFNDTGSTGNANGSYAYGSLIISGHKLYGMTYEGGAHGYGVAFSINTDGSGYKDLWDFYDTGRNGNANGTDPNGSLLLVGNRLYGMTYRDGGNSSYDEGLVFSIDTAGGGYKDLYDFMGNNTSGSYPRGSLSNLGKTLFGITPNGGEDGRGTIFSIDTNGANYKDLHDFNYSGGSYPYGSLTLAGRKMFGTVYDGASGYDDGGVFSVDTDGSNYKVIMSFNYGNGEYSYGDVALSGNRLYGMTYEGGTYDVGTIFSVDTDGSEPTSLYSFDYTHGAYTATGAPVISGGTLYGMAYEGGLQDYGTVFSMDLCSLFSVSHSSTSDNGTGTGTATVVANGGPTPYDYMWSPGGGMNDTINGKFAGTYTCVVTNPNGCVDTAVVTINSTAGVGSIAGSNSAMVLYPNPNEGMFTVSMGSNAKAGVCNLEVYNTLGQQILTKTLNDAQGDNSINMSNQPNGVYLYRIVTLSGNVIKQGKLVIQK